MDESIILETRGLTKESKGFVAVNNVDLDVLPGETAIVPAKAGNPAGPNVFAG